MITPEDLDDFRLHLKAANRSPATIRSYMFVARRWWDHGAPQDKRSLERYFAEGFSSPGYAALHYRSLQQLFKWAEHEGVIQDNPFRRMRPPHVPEKPIPVLSDDDLRRLLDACRGRDLLDIRDTAMIRFLLDTGVRVGELVGLAVQDLDHATASAVVLGKGRRPRIVPYGDRTNEALRRYLRARRRLTAPELWLGPKGPLTTQGVREALVRRSKLAGLPRFGPHVLRHTWAHRWLAAGGQETDLVRLAGWRSRQMVERYGASAAHERAVQAHRRAALGDRL